MSGDEDAATGHDPAGDVRGDGLQVCKERAPAWGGAACPGQPAGEQAEIKEEARPRR